MDPTKVSKSAFKPKAFEYLRRAEQGERIRITDHGRSVVDIVPCRATDEDDLSTLRGLVERYEAPLEPLEEQWDADR